MTPRFFLASTLVLALVSPLAATGCARDFQPPPCMRPDLGGCAVEEIDIEGNGEVGGDEITSRIATAETSHPLMGAFEHVPVLSIIDTLTVEYERFDRFVLERDLARIERYYRARGFYSARVRAARVQKIAPEEGGRVRVNLVVEEGAPVKVASVDIQWQDWDVSKGMRVLLPVMNARNKLKGGERFEEELYEETKETILRAVTDRGFAYATVDGRVQVDLVTREARVVYTVKLGPLSRFGKIVFEGLGELPERPFRAALDMEEGDVFSTEELEDGERALSEFGVFGAIDVQVHRAPEGQPQNPVVPVTFRVQPSALRSVRLGGGGELGGRTEAHLVAGWEDRNFLGGLRRFSVEARPGLVFYPTTFSTLFTEAPTTVLPEIQVRAELRQPALIEGRTTGVLRSSARIYRLQTSQFDITEATDLGAEPPIVGYREYAGAVGFERPFLTGDFNAALLYNVQLNDPFTYNAVPVPAGFRTLLIPYIQTIVSFDLRRNRAGKPDRVDPRRGIYIGVDAQLAGHLGGWGDADDVRIQPEFRAYVPVSRKVTLAMRLLFGALVPQNYGESLAGGDCSDLVEGTPAHEDCSRKLTSDVQLLQFRGFFSGGASSNRGYAYNEVGPYGEVVSLTNVEEVNVPTGGLSLWESSLELRIPVSGNIGSTVFLDASDVTRSVAFYRLTRPHLSAGVGFRYATPVGPLRLDVGYRLPCLQVLGVCPGEALPESENQEPGKVGPLPIAVSIAIGEAF